MRKTIKIVLSFVLSVIMALTLIPATGMEKVQASGTILSSVNLLYNKDALKFHTLNTEAAVYDNVLKNISSDTTGVNVFQNSNSGLNYWDSDSKVWATTIGSTNMIRPDTEYAIMFGVEVLEGYDYPASIKAHELSNIGNLKDISDFTVNVGGIKLTDAQFFYSESYKCICVYVPIGKPVVAEVKISKVEIKNPPASVKKGGYYNLKAEVSGEYIEGYDGLKWTVSGKNGADTYVFNDGDLYIDANETATSITLTATSEYDNTKSDSITIPVTSEALSIDKVTVSPEAVSVKQGSHFLFDCQLIGDHNDRRIIWSVIGAKSSYTVIDDEEGYLYVAKDETAKQFTVRATSKADKSKYADAVVTVQEANIIDVLDLNYDFDKLNFYIGNTESEVQAAAREIISTTTTGAEVHHNSNSALECWKDGLYWEPVVERNYTIDSATEYAIMFGVEAKEKYEYPESVMSYPLESKGNLSDLSDFTVNVNGEPLIDAVFFYAESWNMVCIYVPIGKAKTGIVEASVDGVKDKDFTGNKITQDITVKLGTKTLVEGTDYKVEYENNVNAGKATVTIRGTGEYAGSITKEFTIKPISLADAAVTGIEDKAYTGNEILQNPVVKLGGKTLEKDKDYTIEYKDNTNPGTATVTIKGKGNYEGTITKSFNITNLSIADAEVTGVANKVYTGNEIKQIPVVKLGGKTLAADTDYTISYKNNINAGTATMTITGKGSYTGTKDVTFEINKASCKLKYKVKKKSFSAKAKKNTSFKYSKLFTINKSNKKGKLEFKKVSGNKRITISKSGKVTVKKGLTPGKTYSIKVKARIKGDTNYKNSGWVKKTIKFKIKK